MNPASKFSSSAWLDMFTGIKFQPGSFGTVPNEKFGQYIPMFMLEGTMLLLQDTTGRKKTSLLDNRYGIVAAFE